MGPRQADSQTDELLLNVSMPLPTPPDILVSVLIIGLSYGARNVLSYTGHMMQSFLAFRDSPVIPLRRSPSDRAQPTANGDATRRRRRDSRRVVLLRGWMDARIMDETAPLGRRFSFLGLE